METLIKQDSQIHQIPIVHVFVGEEVVSSQVDNNSNKIYT